MPSVVDGPSRARGTTWSNSTRSVEPQTSPSFPLIGHWQRPPSRFQTSRLTRAGTCAGPDGRGCFRGFADRPLRLAWSARMRSRPASRISSAPAPGWE